MISRLNLLFWIAIILCHAQGCGESEKRYTDTPPFIPVTEPVMRGYPNLKATTENKPRSGSLQMDSPFILPPVATPVTFPASEVTLADSERVIGVVCGEEAIAYSCTAMSQMESHVINDVVGEKGLTVTFCDRTMDTRVFCSPSGNTPLKIQVGGITDKAMVLYVDGQMYEQSSADIPLSDYNFVLTTWKEWKTDHPNSRVYTGGTKSR